jgi:hypothetical protein
MTSGRRVCIAVAVGVYRNKRNRLQGRAFLTTMTIVHGPESVGRCRVLLPGYVRFLPAHRPHMGVAGRLQVLHCHCESLK